MVKILFVETVGVILEEDVHLLHEVTDHLLGKEWDQEVEQEEGCPQAVSYFYWGLILDFC